MEKSNIPNREQEIYIAVKLYLENVKTYASTLNRIAAKLHENVKTIPLNEEDKELSKQVLLDLEEVQKNSKELLNISTKLYNDEVDGTELVRSGERMVYLKARCEKMAKKLNLPIKTIEETGGETLEKSSYKEQIVSLLIEINSLLLEVSHKVINLPGGDGEKLLLSAEKFNNTISEFIRNHRSLDEVEVEYLEEWLNDMKYYKEKLIEILGKTEELKQEPRLLN